MEKLGGTIICWIVCLFFSLLLFIRDNSFRLSVESETWDETSLLSFVNIGTIRATAASVIQVNRIAPNSKATQIIVRSK